MVRQISKNSFLKYYGVIIFITIWWIVKMLFFRYSSYLAGPFETFSQCIYLFRKSDLSEDFVPTIILLFKGFSLAAITAIPLGLLLGYFKKGYATFEVIIDFFRSIPVTALFPLFILFFGISTSTIMAMITVSCFWVILINSIYGVIYVNSTYLEVMDSFKATTFQKFKEVIFYEALPFLFIGLRVAISFGLIVVIVSEMFIGTQHGLGERVYIAYENNRNLDVYSLTMIIGVLGYLFNKLLLFLEKKIIHWKGQSNEFN